MTHVHPTQDDPVVAGLSEVVGGPAGSRAGRSDADGRRAWRATPLAVLLLLTGLTFAAGMASKAACAAHGFDGSAAGAARVCGSDVARSYVDNGFAELAWPWSTDPETRRRHPAAVEPAGVGLWSAAAARVTHALAGSPDITSRYDVPVEDLGDDPDVRHERVLFTAVNVVGFAVLALLSTLALAAVRRRRPWDAAGFAVAPVLALAGPVSWDLLPVAAVAGACWAWSRDRLVVAGALVGVGAATGGWPVLLLPAAGLVIWRRRGPGSVVPELLPSVVTAGAAWAAVNAPAVITGKSVWRQYWHQLAQRPPEQGSLWTILDQTAGVGTHAAHLAAWVMVLMWAVGVGVVCWAAPVPPRLSQVALLLVAGVTLFGVTYRPEQALWLLPLAALARPRWRDLLVWQAGEVLFLAMDSWWHGGWLAPGGGGSSGFYWLAIAIRMGCTLWLVFVVGRDMMDPRRDPALTDVETQSTTTRSNVVAV